VDLEAIVVTAAGALEGWTIEAYPTIELYSARSQTVSAPSRLERWDVRRLWKPEAMVEQAVVLREPAIPVIELGSMPYRPVLYAGCFL